MRTHIDTFKLCNSNDYVVKLFWMWCKMRCRLFLSCPRVTWSSAAWIKSTLLCASLTGGDGERGKKREEPTLSGSWYLSPSWPERFFPRDRLSGRHAPGTFWKARSTAHNGRARSPKQKPCFARFVHLSPFHFLPTSSPSHSPGKQPHEGYARSLALDSLFAHAPAEKKLFMCKVCTRVRPEAYFEAAFSWVSFQNLYTVFDCKIEF